MFRHRWRLSETEKREYRVIGEELNAAGAMLDLSSFRTPTTSMLRLQQVGEAYARTYDRGSVYVVHVSILCLASLLILDEFTVGSSDWNLGAYMVDDPIIASPSNLLYRMMDGTTFHRNEVLNHRLGAGFRLRRGEQVEGLILAQAFEVVPAQYPPGTWVNLTLGTCDQFGSPHTWPVTVCVQPSQPKHCDRRPRFPWRSVFEGVEMDPIDAPQPTPLSPDPAAERSVRGSMDVPEAASDWVERVHSRLDCARPDQGPIRFDVGEVDPDLSEEGETAKTSKPSSSLARLDG